MEIERITSGAALDDLLATARSEGRCALDTEFVWERTYAPRLCLAQIATAERVAVVDPLEGASLEPVAALVADPAVTCVMHAPAADLTGFGLHYDVRPHNVFDVQLAAGFAGLGGSLSLERVIDQSVGIQLHHAEGFTDWSKRPLTPVQVEYAADDVRHLLAAADALTNRLERLGRLSWAQEETERRFGPASSVVQDPEQAWRRVQGRGKLRAGQLGALMAIAAWREREARRRDTPVAWLVRDATLIELARRRPKTADDARGVRGLQIKRGPQLDGLLAAIREGEQNQPERPPETPPELRARVRAVLPLASSVLQARCSSAGIASELVATRDDLESLIRYAGGDGQGDLPPLLTGWRRELAGDSLLALLRGEVVLRVVPGPPHVDEQPA